MIEPKAKPTTSEIKLAIMLLEQNPHMPSKNFTIFI